MIKWVRMEETGKPVPVEPIPDLAGTVAARLVGHRLVGYVVSAARPLQDGYTLHRAHHGECAKRARDTPPTTRAELPPALF